MPALHLDDIPAQSTFSIYCLKYFKVKLVQQNDTSENDIVKEEAIDQVLTRVPIECYYYSQERNRAWRKQIDGRTKPSGGAQVEHSTAYQNDFLSLETKQ